MAVSAVLRRQVIERAESHCEYCGLAQTGQEATFHITQCQLSPAEVRRWKISHWHASPGLFAKVVGCSYQIRRRTNTSPPSTHVSTPGRLISAGKEYGLWDSRPQDAPQSRRSIRIALLHWRSWKRKHRLQKAG